MAFDYESSGRIDTGLTLRGNKVVAQRPDESYSVYDLTLHVPSTERYCQFVPIRIFERGGVIVGSCDGDAPNRTQEFKFDLTALESAELWAWKESADAQWATENADLIARRNRRNLAVAHACALEGLPQIASDLECLECGAVYAEAGHVQFGGMGCDRCH